MRRILTALLLAAAMAVSLVGFTSGAATAAPASHRHTYVYTDGMGPRWSGPRYRPPQISFGALYDVTRMRWTTWHSNVAYGRGHYYQGRGAPNYEAYVALYDVKTHNGRRYFSQIKISEPGHKGDHLWYSGGLWHNKYR